ncbi:MAG: S-adenosylmethionine:tRNA ribosyltransferase-isomerase, partial [Oscillospiraceae bacterium]|nr:S-adenosylmethionine:tRNA ribosyltransferase-isomerase [Oscillospiraceae bacterium]
MKKSDFYFDLPDELIAQSPIEHRDHARLLCVSRMAGALEHRYFYELPDILSPGDLLVLNDSKVIPARLLGIKEPTGAAIEFLLLEKKADDIWEILVRPGRKAMPGTVVSFGGGILRGEVLDILEGGNRLARFSYDLGHGDFYALLDQIGLMPLPHYITEKLEDNTRYQTVYAKDRGSAAAPTAGLHFTPDLLNRLDEKGIDRAFVTLHVGLGTFRPVKSDNIEDHRMHTEH